MNTYHRASIALLASFVSLAFGETAATTSKSGSDIAPPPFVNVPGQNDKAISTVDAATEAISKELRQSIAKSHETLKTTGGGAEFRPALNYVAGKPIVMLVAPKTESVEVKFRRLNVITKTMGIILDDAAFDQGTISVLSYNPLKPTEQTVRNYTITRAQFQAAAKKVGKTDTAKDAINKISSDDETMQKVCAELGIE